MQMIRNQALPIFVVLSLLFISSCLDTVSTKPERTALTDTFQDLLQETIDDSFESVPGVSMCVIAPELDVVWEGAAGFDSKEKDSPLNAAQPFRIASVTKTFVATAILRLAEMDKLDIDASITSLISVTHDSLLRAGGYDPDIITWRQILHHTSGLYDYAMADPTYTQLALRDPQHRWTRTEQLALAMDVGTPTPPDSAYHYSDTGYILAGEAIELALDTSLAAGLRFLLNFEDLGLKSTWLETLEIPPVNHLPFVHRYFRRDDTTEWDPSVDLYGGGGLVSTSSDLAHFMHALFNDQVFDDSNTLSTMLSPPVYAPTYDIDKDKRYKDYRLGLWRIEVFDFDAYMHGGLWGSGFIHVPALNCTIAVNCTAGRWERLLQKTILIIKNLQETT